METILTERQYRALMATDAARLSPDQIARHKEFWDQVPRIDRLYSSMLGDIEGARRLLDQKTYGPEQGIPEDNLCQTPMSIAGHTVNRAGSAGMRLKEKFGFANAAALIHDKSRPGVSRPRYDSYPNEWALAYIQERAEEENLTAE
jgi:hypothetical protein